MAKYRLSNIAKEDVERIYLYGLERYGAEQAESYYMALFEQFEKIAENPEAYQGVDDIKPGYRQCVCGADSIYYRENAGVVEIMAVLGRQNFTRLLRGDLPY